MRLKWIFIILLALLLASCQKELSTSLPSGAASNADLEGSPVSTLDAGRYQMFVEIGGIKTLEEAGTYALDGDRIMFSPSQTSTLAEIDCSSSLTP